MLSIPDALYILSIIFFTVSNIFYKSANKTKSYSLLSPRISCTRVGVLQSQARDYSLGFLVLLLPPNTNKQHGDDSLLLPSALCAQSPGHSQPELQQWTPCSADVASIRHEGIPPPHPADDPERPFSLLTGRVDSQEMLTGQGRDTRKKPYTLTYLFRSVSNYFNKAPTRNQFKIPALFLVRCGILLQIITSKENPGGVLSDAQVPCLPEATCLEGCQENRPSGLVDVNGSLVQERFQLPLLPRASLRRPVQAHPDLRALTGARVRRHPGVKREGLLNKVLRVIKPGSRAAACCALESAHLHQLFQTESFPRLFGKPLLIPRSPHSC